MTNVDTSSPDKAQSQSMIPFFIIWAGQAFSLMGSSLVAFALIWWLTETTGSAKVLAFAAIVAVVPPVFLSPVTGTLIDRWNRRRVIVAADIAIALATVTLALLFALGIKEIWIVFLILFIRAIGTAFHRPAMMASTTLMVPVRHYSRIAGLNNAMRGATTIVSPPVAALLLAMLPIQGILAIDVCTAFLAIVPLLFIAIPQPERGRAPQTKPPSVWDDMLVGLRFIKGWPGLMMLIGVYAMVHLLFAPSMALMPLLVTEHFHGGALQLGWLEAAVGIGLVAGGLTLGVWGGFQRRMTTAMLALAFMGVGVMGVGLTPADAFPGALCGMFLVGFMLSFVTGLRVAVLQASVPPEKQGRVMTVALTGTAATDPLGLAVAGPLADALGVRIWYVLCGIITVVMGAGSFLVRPIMHIEGRVHPDVEEEEAPARSEEPSRETSDRVVPTVKQPSPR